MSQETRLGREVTCCLTMSSSQIIPFFQVGKISQRHTRKPGIYRRAKGNQSLLPLPTTLIETLLRYLTYESTSHSRSMTIYGPQGRRLCKLPGQTPDLR